MNLEQRIADIEERNSRVETDKAWEGSVTRRLIIATITYTVAGTFMSYVEVKDPWLSALIPTGGYLLSTLGLKVARNIWENNRPKAS